MSLLGASTAALKRGLASSVPRTSSRGLKVIWVSRLWRIQYADWPRQVLAVLYQGGEAAKQEPRLLGTTENQVSILFHQACIAVGRRNNREDACSGVLVLGPSPDALTLVIFNGTEGEREKGTEDLP